MLMNENSVYTKMTFFKDLTTDSELKNLSQSGFDFAYNLQDVNGVGYSLEEYFSVNIAHQIMTSGENGIKNVNFYPIEFEICGSDGI
jgi:hypothetical protein